MDGAVPRPPPRPWHTAPGLTQSRNVLFIIRFVTQSIADANTRSIDSTLVLH